ncbi:hypothetical protein EON83_22345 [bacterium]|nr:MAG: hypothetical protein EON83_22345 [bacterium]
MNIQRFVWVVMTLLFGVVGALGGFLLGRYYVDVVLPRVVGPAPGAIGTGVPFVLALGLCVVGARFGLFFADRVILGGLRRMSQLSAADRVLGIAGALLGLLFGVLITVPLNTAALNTPGMIGVKFCVLLIASAVGMAMLGGMRSEMLRVFPQLEEEKIAQSHGARPKFLDTNIIIDGRLADLCKTGFIEGPIYVPTFVLEEVQHIADSSDAIRRARGRRGLDVLNAMKELTEPQMVNGQPVLVPVVHVLGDFPNSVNKIHAVDSKLVALAREREGVIITNDFNLNKVAELQGVRVLNLNELAQAIKPVVLPGEEMQISLVKEGKEPTQGVGYLDDGTMVVVTDAAQHIGETCAVIISTVYQTVAGKMIFAELKDKEVTKPSMRGSGDDLFGDSGGSNNNNRGERGGRYGDDYGNRSGGGMRRKSRT